MSASRVLRRPLVVFLYASLAAMLVFPLGRMAHAAATPPHVMMVVMENTSYEQIVGNSQMPFVNGQVAVNGSVSTTDLSHPSEPNYLGITSGSIYDNPADLTPQDKTYAGPQLTDELASAGITWKAYMEDMPVACDLTDQFGPANYDVNHNPFMYYDSVRNNPSQCNRVVPYPQLTADLNAGTAPSFIWVSPNLINDMHDGTPAQGDSFLQGLVARVQASTWWTAGSRIIITWDEGASTEQVLTLVIGSAHGTAATGGNEYGTLRGLEEAYGVGLLGASANAANGDILPLLTGAPPPAPSPTPTPAPSPSPSPSPTPSPSPSPTPSASPSPTPSASPSPTPSASPTPTPSAAPSPSPSPSPSPNPFRSSSSDTRGIFRYTSTDFGAMHSAGFNASTDGGVQDNGVAQAANGITGMVWVDAYDNTSCSQTMTNTAIAAMVQANVAAGHPGLRYEIGDEPTTNGCNAAPVYSSITQAVHGADATAKTWTADDQFQTGAPIQAGVPMKGSVDILAFDVYPCESGACDYSAIDSAVAQIHAANVTNWEFILQDFSSSPWRWPTPAEIQAQFDHWKNQGAIGYWVYAWDYQGQQVIQQAGNIAALKSINSQAINGSSPSPTPTPSPSPSSSPSPSPSTSPSPSPSPSLSPPPAAPAACAGTALFTTYFSWFDNASPGMLNDNIHLLNKGGATSTGCVTVGSVSVPFSLAAGQETHVTFPAGTIGGPVVVSVNSGPAVLASQRVQYYKSFNEVWAMTPAQAATTSYFNWFDKASPGMFNDNIHIVNPGNTTATGGVTVAGGTPVAFSIAAGAESYLSFPPGTIGGPVVVTVTSGPAVLASQRVQYYQTFNEVESASAAGAATTSYFPWYDKASPGMFNDNIHLVNPGATSSNVTVSLPGATNLLATVGAGAEAYVSFPAGTIGGPVTVVGSQPVLASQRVQYYQSFNEASAGPTSKATTASYFMWFDKASPGMVNDNIHIVNPGAISATVTVSLPGASSITVTVGAGAETYISFPLGAIGGAVMISSTQPVMAAQRVQYYKTFNEVPSSA